MKSVALIRAVVRRLVTAYCVWALLLAAAAASAQVSFYTVVDQALRNSHQVRIAEADVRKSEGALRELRDAYIPSLSVGSGLGYSFGFTINPPTLYNITSQSLLFSFSQRDYIRAARAGLHGAQMHLSDQRQQVILDAAESYIELDALQQSLAALHDEGNYSERLIGIVTDRFAAGLDSKVAVTSARLDAARVNLKQVQMRNRVSELQDHLSRLTALPPDTIRTDTASIPATPGLKPGERITGTTPAIEAAFDNARAKQYQAFGVKREEYRPQAGLAAQYNRYSTLTNFQNNFTNFTPNNFGIGLNLNWPLIDETRRAKRVQADADASRAHSEFLQARDQSAEGVLKLENSFEQIAAQQQLAALTAELAKDKLDAILTQTNSRASGETSLTPKDEQTARIEERERYLDVLDARLSLAKIQLELLRATGGIEPWAKSAISTVSSQPAPSVSP
jgi:outer membrane protein TolC